jgi:hypothetical protein
LRYAFVTIVAIIVPLRAYVLFRHGVKPTRLTVAMYGLLLTTALIAALWYGPIADAGGLETYLTTIGESVIVTGILAVTGEALGILCVAGRTGRAIWGIGAGLAICLLMIGSGVMTGWGTTAELRMIFRSEIDESVYNYLALGDSIALLGLLMIGLIQRPTIRVGLLAIISIALFFAYSRTSFFLFLLSAPLVLLVGSGNAQRIGVAVLGAAVLAIAFHFAGQSGVLGSTIERMTVLIFEREADESYLVRQTLLAEGIRNLTDNWMIGRFLDEWWREGAAGNYMHNWLSFWQAYGVIPFLGSIALFGTTGFKVWRQLLKPNPLTGIVIALWTYVILAIIAARAYTWPFIWLAFGFITATRYAQSNDNRVRAVLARRR